VVVTLAADHASDRRWGAGQLGTINRENRAGPKPPDNIGDHARRIHPVQAPATLTSSMLPALCTYSSAAITRKVACSLALRNSFAMRGSGSTAITREKYVVSARAAIPVPAPKSITQLRCLGGMKARMRWKTHRRIMGAIAPMSFSHLTESNLKRSTLTFHRLNGISRTLRPFPQRVPDRQLRGRVCSSTRPEPSTCGDGSRESSSDAHLYLNREATTAPFGPRQAFAAGRLRSNGLSGFRRQRRCKHSESCRGPE
jgi:hypothetical protein